MAKTKALISCAVTAQLICVFVFAYAKSRFSHDEAQMIHFIEHVFFQKAFPARIGSINYYNTGPVFEAAMEAFRPFLSKKLKERVRCRCIKIN